MMTAPPERFNGLEDFACLDSGDDVNRDLELTCLRCGVVICHVEHADTLHALALTAAGHEHNWRLLEYWAGETVAARWMPPSRAVTSEDGDLIGTASTAEQARMLVRGHLAHDPGPYAVTWRPADEEMTVLDTRRTPRPHRCPWPFNDAGTNAGGHRILTCERGNHAVIAPHDNPAHQCAAPCASAAICKGDQP
jgi:hypothetical protein